MASIKFDASAYKYPSIEEKVAANLHYPEFNSFNFPYINELKLVMVEDKSFEEAKRQSDLYWWELSLNNKLGKLNNAFTNTVVNYERAFGSMEMQKVAEYELHKFQFNFYAETFYYYLFSSRDITFQIINIYFDPTLPEHKVKYDTIILKVNDKIKSILEQFDNEIKSAAAIRNSFTHRFPVNTKDHRAKIVKTEKGKEYHAGTGDVMDPKVIYENVKFSIDRFAQLVNELIVEMSNLE